ncbi:MAG: asparagine synthase (glutamine-hydrolyzing) [Candidatus Babeliales bacterium]
MCGIAGLANISRTQSPISVELLEQMQQALAHRGPNGYRIWLNNDHSFGIAHRRLSILDVSAAGAQPMMNKEKNIIIACNGEIYNFKQLRHELEQLGYTFQSHSDSEVIVYAYQQWGIECLERFEGMFALVIVDLRMQEIYLVRDRQGIKPLYFSFTGGMLSFASEIKALWLLPWMSKTVNHLSVYHYLTYLVSPAPLTVYDGVYKLPAGYYVKLDARKQTHFVQWYSPLQPTIVYEQKNYEHESTVIKTVTQLLRASVRNQMVSDVPIGAFLSGGVDSSLIVALMAQESSNVKTFNVSFSDGQEWSELGWARKIARTFQTDHHELIISEKEAFDFFESMVYYQDEPLADCVCIPLYYVAKLLKDAGVTVALVGEGSDELFCGYSTYARYIDIYQTYWRRSQQYIPSMARKTAYQLAQHFLNNRYTRINMNAARIDTLYNWAYNRSLFWSGATAFSETNKTQLFTRSIIPERDPIMAQIYPDMAQQLDSYALVEYHLKKLKKQRPDADFLTSMIYLELKHRLPELLLTRVDKMTMATAVEARVPFLDTALVEYAFQMPSTYKYYNGVTKYILKKVAERFIPHETIYRPKVGFAAPTMRWFKEGAYFKPYLKSLLHKQQGEDSVLNRRYITHLFESNEKGLQDNSLQLWTLQNLLASDIGEQL